MRIAAQLLAITMAGVLNDNDEPLSFPDLLFDLISILLLVATTVSCSRVALRLGIQREESRALRADMAPGRSDSRQWRMGMDDGLRELSKAIHRQCEDMLTPSSTSAPAPTLTSSA